MGRLRDVVHRRGRAAAALSHVRRPPAHRRAVDRQSAVKGQCGWLATTTRIPLGRAHMLASTIMRDAHRARIAADQLVPLGSMRRYSPDIGDVSLLAVAPAEHHQNIIDTFATLAPVTHVVSTSATCATAATDRGDVTLHLATPEHAGTALVWHTGSRRHTQQLQQLARQRGLTLDKARLVSASGAPLAAPTEETLYEHLGLPFIPPELREGDGEIAAAERGELPSLVSER